MRSKRIRVVKVGEVVVLVAVDTRRVVGKHGAAESVGSHLLTNL